MSELKQAKPLPVDPTAATTLVDALSRAQGQMRNAIFDRKNRHFDNAYASLPALIDAIRKPLADNGLAITQTTHPQQDGNLYLITTLHGYGETIESYYPMPSNVKPQEFGSALTYARRYQLSAMLNISSDEDDDANLAQAAGNGKVITAEQIISPAQVETLQMELADLVAEDKNLLPNILKWAGITTLQHLQAARYEYVLGQLKAKKERLAKEEAMP